MNTIINRLKVLEEKAKRLSTLEEKIEQIASLLQKKEEKEDIKDEKGEEEISAEINKKVLSILKRIIETIEEQLGINLVVLTRQIENLLKSNQDNKAGK